MSGPGEQEQRLERALTPSCLGFPRWHCCNLTADITEETHSSLPLHSATALPFTRQRTIKNAKPWHGTKSGTWLLVRGDITVEEISAGGWGGGGVGVLQSEYCINKTPRWAQQAFYGLVGEVFWQTLEETGGSCYKLLTESCALTTCTH